MKVIKSEIQKKLVIPLINKTVFIPLDDIIYIESDNSYSRLILSGQPTLMVSKHLKFIEELLGEYNFIRCHRKFLVNSNHIVEFKHGKYCHLKVSNSTTIQVSKPGCSRLKQFIGSI